MNYQEIINELKSLSSQEYKTNIIKMGIPETNCLGVSTKIISKLARTIPKSNSLAYQLWQSGYHEAKIMAVFLFNSKQLTLDDIETLMSDVASWDLCNHLCKHLIVKIENYEILIKRWCNSSKTYFKRAAFVLISDNVIHNKGILDTTIDNYLKLIFIHSDDTREHVKKAIAGALKEIGKKDFAYNEKALLLAHELQINGNKNQQKLAKNVLKEIENLVQADGRTRLISKKSKMGQNK